MNKMIVEVGSTCTKIDHYDGKKLERVKEITIEFKKHYMEDKKLRENDIIYLIECMNNLKEQSNDIYVCGTSIFRSLSKEEKEQFLTRFKEETKLSFHIITQEQETELTVLGATKGIKRKACILIGGGGSTEIAIFDKRIIQVANSDIGVIDIMQKFPDLAQNIANTNLEDVKKYIKTKLNIPKEKADVLILAGGGHEKFARLAGIKYEDNTIYKENSAPIMMDMQTRTEETKRYFEKISLDEIRNRVDDPNWWDATRAMCAVVLVVAEEIAAKYIIPTNISMVYGILDQK